MALIMRSELAGPGQQVVAVPDGRPGTILGGVNFLTTIFCMRAPDMTMFRMPIFCRNTENLPKVEFLPEVESALKGGS